jgi:hypothetical protein
MSGVVAFLEGQGPDHAGRTIADVLAFGLGDLERHHDYIQWLFPLTEASAAVAGSPVLTAGDVEALRRSRIAQANLVSAAERMEWFYDLTDHWLRPADHNHLRITRIIKSLRLIVGDIQANVFRSRILARVAARRVTINAASLRYWAEA